MLHAAVATVVLPCLEMFIGHFGLALAAKRIAPKASLGALFFAAEFLDLLWPIFLLVGLEHVRIAPGITRMQPLDFYDYPYSHSLTMTLKWSLAVGLIYYLARRYVRGAWVASVLVASHWVLDYITHRPDMPLSLHGPKVGLGLWNFPVPAIGAEILLFAVGIWLYLSVSRARDDIGRYAFWSLMVLLSLGWVASLLAVPPPDPHQLALGTLGLWLVIPWAWWADSHRNAPSQQ
jgi:hypothetical protein